MISDAKLRAWPIFWRVILTEMWTRSLSEAASAPGKSSSELTQRVGYRVRLHARDMASDGCRSCSLAPPPEFTLLRMTTTIAAEMAEATMSVAATIIRSLSLDFFGVGVRSVAWLRTELPPGSAFPSLP